MSDEADEAARKARAEQLRKQIRGLADGRPSSPARPPTPREITDEAARKRRESEQPGGPPKRKP
jgi:hypothetical protein